MNCSRQQACTCMNDFSKLMGPAKWCNASMWCWHFYILPPSIELELELNRIASHRIEPWSIWFCACTENLKTIEQCFGMILALSFEFWLLYMFKHCTFSQFLRSFASLMVHKHRTIHSFMHSSSAPWTPVQCTIYGLWFRCNMWMATVPNTGCLAACCSMPCLLPSNCNRLPRKRQSSSRQMLIRWNINTLATVEILMWKLCKRVCFWWFCINDEYRCRIGMHANVWAKTVWVKEKN